MVFESIEISTPLAESPAVSWAAIAAGAVAAYVVRHDHYARPYGVRRGQLFHEPRSAIMGLDLVEMTVDNSRRATSDF
jgi:hypothetical protein